MVAIGTEGERAEAGAIGRELVVIPVYNEEGTIAAVLGELCRYFRGDVLVAVSYTHLTLPTIYSV